MTDTTPTFFPKVEDPEPGEAKQLRRDLWNPTLASDAARRLADLGLDYS